MKFFCSANNAPRQTTTCPQMLIFKGTGKRLFALRRIPTTAESSAAGAERVTFFAAHKKTSWQLLCPFVRSFLPCQVCFIPQGMATCWYRLAFYPTHTPSRNPMQSQQLSADGSHLLSQPAEQTKLHPLPSYVLACEATGCVTIFATHTFAHLHAHCKNLHCATSGTIVPLQVAPAGGTRALHSLHFVTFIPF